jgi:hypothetical protein
MKTYLSCALSIVNSCQLRQTILPPLSNQRMKTVEEVRRVRLEALIAEAGSIVALNEKLGLDKRDSTLSQYKNRSESSKGGPPKAMGSDVARRLEMACGRERGWMDTDPDLWPFRIVDQAKVSGLKAELLAAIELSVVTAATALGIDVAAAPDIHAPRKVVGFM